MKSVFTVIAVLFSASVFVYSDPIVQYNEDARMYWGSQTRYYWDDFSPIPTTYFEEIPSTPFQDWRDTTLGTNSFSAVTHSVSDYVDNGYAYGWNNSHERFDITFNVPEATQLNLSIYNYWYADYASSQFYFFQSGTLVTNISGSAFPNVQDPASADQEPILLSYTLSGGSYRVLVESINGRSSHMSVSGEFTAIPEPASMALIGLFTAGIWVKRRFFIG